MNTIAAITVLVGSLIAAAGIIAYPRLRLLMRAPARLNERERARLLALLPWRGLLDARQLERLPRLAARLRPAHRPRDREIQGRYRGDGGRYRGDEGRCRGDVGEM